VNVGTLLAVRFTIGAALFWMLVLARRERPRIRPRDVAIALLLGAIGYSAQAGLYFAALERIDASILSLLLYTFPAIVTVAAVVIGRERANRRRLAALALTSSGLVLVLAGAAGGAFDAIGASLALGAAFVYSAYILTSEPTAARVSPYLLSALVCTGAAVTLSVGAAGLGQLHPEAVTATGWLWLAGIGAVSTVAAIGMFFAGLRRVGPSSAAILATVEPVVTVMLAFAVFGETLGAVQIAGAALVLSSVLVLRNVKPATVAA
jgi:drug/metabolite transporter (DMT)-like permease